MRVPLKVCVGASNALPDDPSLAAFADRFLLNVFLDPLPDPRLEELLESGWSFSDEPAPGAGRLTSIDTLRAALPDTDLTAVRPLLAEAIRTLRSAGIELTDRRAVRIQRLVAAVTLLDGRLTSGHADLWPIVFAVPSPIEQAVARDALRELLDQSRNQSLIHAAEAASSGPKARAQRLAHYADTLLAQGPGADQRNAWLLKLEGVVREIDAGFAEEHLTEDLKGLRDRVVALIGSAPAHCVDANV